MRIAICDDEQSQRALLAKYLQEWARDRRRAIEVLPFQSAEQFLFSWEDDRRFDLLMLDIEMGAVSGMQLAARVREEEEELPILFITGYEQYMAQGYEVSAIQYLLKPVEKEKLFAVLDRLQRRKKAEPKEAFRTQEGVLLLAPSEIWYVEAAGHDCLLHAGEKTYQVRHSLAELLHLFAQRKDFVRCHRSFLVNLAHISAITRTEVVMDDGVGLPVSRSAHRAVNDAFLQNYGIAYRGR